MISLANSLAQGQIVFFVWVTLTEHKWVILAERRGRLITGLLVWPEHGNVTSAMRAIGYARVSTDKQAERGCSLDAQAEKIRAMTVVHEAELLDIIVDGGE